MLKQYLPPGYNFYPMQNMILYSYLKYNLLNILSTHLKQLVFTLSFIYLYSWVPQMASAPYSQTFLARMTNISKDTMSISLVISTFSHSWYILKLCQTFTRTIKLLLKEDKDNLYKGNNKCEKMGLEL